MAYGTFVDLGRRRTLLGRQCKHLFHGQGPLLWTTARWYAGRFIRDLRSMRSCLIYDLMGNKTIHGQKASVAVLISMQIARSGSGGGIVLCGLVGLHWLRFRTIVMYLWLWRSRNRSMHDRDRISGLIAMHHDRHAWKMAWIIRLPKCDTDLTYSWVRISRQELWQKIEMPGPLPKLTKSKTCALACCLANVDGNYWL